MLGADDLDGMGQRLSALVGVDQGGAEARLEQSQPAAQKIGAILHQQRHAVAALQALGHRPMAVRIGAGIQRAITHHLVQIIDRGRLGRGARLGFDDIDDGARAVGLDAGEHQQGAHDMAEIDGFAPDRGREAHAFLPCRSLCAGFALRKIPPSVRHAGKPASAHLPPPMASPCGGRKPVHAET